MLALAAIHNWGQQQLRGFVAAGSPPHPHQTRRRATAPRRKLPLLLLSTEGREACFTSRRPATRNRIFICERPVG